MIREREKRVCIPTDTSYLQDYATKEYEFAELSRSPPSVRKVRKHSVLITANGKLYVCKQCDESFDKSYSLANHVKSFCPKRVKKADDDSTTATTNPSNTINATTNTTNTLINATSNNNTSNTNANVSDNAGIIDDDTSNTPNTSETVGTPVIDTTEDAPTTATTADTATNTTDTNSTLGTAEVVKTEKTANIEEIGRGEHKLIKEDKGVQETLPKEDKVVKEKVVKEDKASKEDKLAKGEAKSEEEESPPRAVGVKRKRRTRRKKYEDSAVMKSDDRESDDEEFGAPDTIEEENKLLDAAIEASLASYYGTVGGGIEGVNLDRVVMDTVTLLGFPVDLVNKLKSLKALKLSLDNGLIDEGQYFMKQGEFLNSFRFL